MPQTTENKFVDRSRLFRQEVLREKLDTTHGAIIVRPYLSNVLLTALFGGIALILIIFFVVTDYTRRVSLNGVLLPSQGLIIVQSTLTSTVREVKVREGQLVGAGDVLFVLASERSSVTRGDAAQGISSLIKSRHESLSLQGARLDEQFVERARRLRERAEDVKSLIQQIDDQIDLQNRRISLSSDVVKQYADLRVANFVSNSQVQLKEAELLDQQQRGMELFRTKASNTREIAQIEAELRDIKIQAEINHEVNRRDLLSIEQALTENEASREMYVRAHAAGTVTGITAVTGRNVSSGTNMAYILPIGYELEAELYAPSTAIGFIKIGLPVYLRYQAYPYQKFGQARGTVKEISSVAMLANELATLTAPNTGSERFYRLRVQLDRQSMMVGGIKHQLQAGAALDSSVLLESRKLYEWLLEPLNSLSARSMPEETSL